jgi:ferritin-like metal-binding protein YciE
MAINDPKELFVLLLSDVRRGTERSTKIYQEMSQAAEDPNIKEVLDARVFLSEKIMTTLDECFRLIGEKPVQTKGRIHDTFIENFREELKEIQSPVARALFILAKANHLIHFRIGEYVTLIAAADMTGNYQIGVLLESCLADKIAMVERSRRLIRRLVESRMPGEKAA